MTIYFVTRHQGAIEWAKQQGLDVDVQVEHLDLSVVEPNDMVIGSLPVNLAAEVCGRGGCYIHLSMDVPKDMRGRELTAENMQYYNARLEKYIVIKGSQNDVK